MLGSPVGAFWSITLYDARDYMLVDNQIDRYSLAIDVIEHIVRRELMGWM